MAYIATDDKLIDPNQPQQGQSTGSAGGIANTGAPAGGGIVNTGGQPAQSAGVGAGGQGMWTNIQSYLNANKDNTESAGYINNKVGGAFDTEKEKLQTESTKAKADAQSQVEQNKLGQDQASKLIEQAGSAYQYGGAPQAQGYQDAVTGVKTKLNAQYGGPKQFSYGLGAQTQEYGSGLQDEGKFRGLMNNMYKDAAGGRIGTGQLSLQNQLDVNNSALNDARTNALAKYSGLQDLYNTAVPETDTAVKNYANQFQTDQNDLRKYVTGQKDENYKQINDAATGFNNEEKAMSDKLNNAKADMDAKRQIYANKYSAVSGNDYFMPTIYKAAAGDAFETGAANGMGNWDQKSFNIENAGAHNWDAYGLAGNLQGGLDPDLAARMNQYGGIEGLGQMIAPSALKYNSGDIANAENIAGVDSQRSRWNAIADMLGLDSRLNKSDKQASHGGYAFDPNSEGYQNLYNDKRGLEKMWGSKWR